VCEQLSHGRCMTGTVMVRLAIYRSLVPHPITVAPCHA